MKEVTIRISASVACGILLLLAVPGRSIGAGEASGAAAPAVERFREAYEMLVMGDEARDAASADEAIRLYREALGLYLSLSREYPDWQPDVTRFRISYCDSQLEVLLRRLEAQSMQAVDDAPRNGDDPSPSVFPPEPVSEKAESPFDPAMPGVGSLEQIRAEAKRVLAGDEPAHARLILLKGLEMAPDDAGVRILMGILHCKVNEHTQAMHLMEQLVQEQPANAVARVVLGAAYFGAGRLEDAEEQIKKAIEANPRMAEAHFNLAQVFMAMSPTHAKAAGLHYRKALELGCGADPALERELRKADMATGDDAWDSPVEPEK
ncbi:MAG: tetratricopeptide repeat protein [Lentisphaerae bacterium]|nr:tetratricopeptide repeat protein [Lentisphaerota bacterium]